MFQGTAEGAARMSINLGTLALLSYGGHLVLAGELTIGTLLAFNVYNLFIGGGLGAISSSLAELSKASGAVARVFDLMPVEEPHPRTSANPAELDHKAAGKLAPGVRLPPTSESVTSRLGTGEHQMFLGRWSNPKRSRRTRTCEYGLQSW